MNTPVDMNDIDSLFPSNYLKASDYPVPCVHIIESVQLEDVGDGKPKPVVRLVGVSKRWVLNRTNAESIKKGYGSHIPHWIGRPVELFSMTVQGPNGQTEGIRCRVHVQPEHPAAPVHPTAPVQPAAPAQPPVHTVVTTVPVQPVVPAADVGADIPKDVETDLTV